MKVTKRQLRQIIHEELVRQQQLQLHEVNIVGTFKKLVRGVERALDGGLDKVIDRGLDKFRQWLEDNADKIPLYVSPDEWKKMMADSKELLAKADEAREQWKKDNPGKTPPWEDTFLGMKKIDLFGSEFIYDPGKEIMNA